jgi:hypothetical protein
MDFPDSINRFPEFDPPIPLCKDLKAAAAPPPAAIGPPKAAAAPALAGKRDAIQDLKKHLALIHPDLVFDERFYPQARAVLNKLEAVAALYKMDYQGDYPEWVYRECCTRNPKSLRALYYTLFCKPDMIAQYWNRKASRVAAEEKTNCPACGGSHREQLEFCPFCGMGTADYGNPTAVEKQKRINAMPPDIRKRYTDELAKLYFGAGGMKLRMAGSLDAQTIEDQHLEIEKKYHLLE